jgi:hypothetical protein
MRPFAWRRWWSAQGLASLRLMAIEHWDPLGVYDNPAHADAYDAYLEDVRTKALARGENEDVDELFADRVVAWYGLEAPKT